MLNFFLGACGSQIFLVEGCHFLDVYLHNLSLSIFLECSANLINLKTLISQLFFYLSRCLVSKLFDVCPRSTMSELNSQEEVRVAWGTGIAGFVAESGEPVNIADAYQVGNLALFLPRISPCCPPDVSQSLTCSVRFGFRKSSACSTLMEN